MGVKWQAPLEDARELILLKTRIKGKIQVFILFSLKIVPQKPNSWSRSSLKTSANDSEGMRIPTVCHLMN